MAGWAISNSDRQSAEVKVTSSATFLFPPIQPSHQPPTNLLHFANRNSRKAGKETEKSKTNLIFASLTLQEVELEERFFIGKAILGERQQKQLT